MTKRTKADDAIERRLLELAYTTDAKLTVPALAYFAPCTLEDAGRVLDDLAARDRLTMDVEDDGTIVYQLLGRQQLPPPTAARPAVAPQPAPAPTLLAPAVRPGRVASPLLAVVMSGFIPGAGHLYAGRVVAAILWFLTVSIGYVLILPGLILHLFAMASAGTAARRLNAAPPRRLLAPAW